MFALPLRCRGSRLIVVLAALVTVPLSSTSWANPSNRTPLSGLDAHGTIVGAKEMTEQIYELCNQVEAALVKMKESESNRSLWSAKEIAKSSGALWKAERDAKRLKLMGEPAGYDLAIRASMLRYKIYVNGLAYCSTREGQKLKQKLDAKLTKGLPRFRKFLASAEKALADGKVEVFIEQMEKTGIDLYEELVFFSPEESGKYFLNFNALLVQGDSIMSPTLAKKYAAEAAQVSMKEAAAAEAFPAEAKRVVSEIASGSAATLADGVSGGPSEAFAYLVDQWEAASAGLIRAHAIDQAFKKQFAPPEWRGRQPEAEALKSTATDSLVALVDAAAITTGGTEVRELHGDLLRQISVVARRIDYGSKAWIKKCNESLTKLAAKDPSFAKQIDAYRRATSEPLAWRRAFAEEQAKQVSTKFPTTRSMLEQKSVATSSIRPNFEPPAGNVARVVAPKSTSEPTHWITHEAATRLIGKEVVELGMRRLSPTSNMGMVPFDGFHYTAVSMPSPAENQINQLRQSLNVTESYGPLTIETADAISSATLGDFEAVGGVIQGVTMEATITRFITLPDIANVLVPLGSVPDFKEDIPSQPTLTWRLDLKPTWVHLTYFNTNVN